MPSKNKRTKTATFRSVQLPNMDIDRLTAIITLPDAKKISKHFQNFCQRLQSNQATVTVIKQNVLITAENEETLEYVRSTIQKEINKFVRKLQHTAKVLPRNRLPFTKPNQWKTPAKRMRQMTCGCGRPLNSYRSTNVTSNSYKKRRFSN